MAFPNMNEMIKVSLKAYQSQQKPNALFERLVLHQQLREMTRKEQIAYFVEEAIQKCQAKR